MVIKPLCVKHPKPTNMQLVSSYMCVNDLPFHSFELPFQGHILKYQDKEQQPLTDHKK